MREKIFKQCLYIKNKVEELKIAFNKYHEESDCKIFKDKIDKIIRRLSLIVLFAYSVNKTISSLSEDQLIKVSDTNEEIVKILEELVEVATKITNINNEFENLSIMMNDTNLEYNM